MAHFKLEESRVQDVGSRELGRLMVSDVYQYISSALRKMDGADLSALQTSLLYKR